MKALSYIISLIFLWSTGAMAFAPGFLQVAGGGGIQSLKYLETFDNVSGYDNTWQTVSGSPNPNSSTVVVSGESLSIPLTGEVRSADVGADIVEITTVINLSSDNTGSTKYLIAFVDSSDSDIAYVQITASMSLKTVCGTANNTGTNTLTTGKTRLWMRYIPGAGNTSVLEVRYAAYTGSETRPSSPEASVTTGSLSSAARKISLINVNGYGMPINFDNVEVIE